MNIWIPKFYIKYDLYICRMNIDFFSSDCQCYHVYFSERTVLHICTTVNKNYFSAFRNTWLASSVCKSICWLGSLSESKFSLLRHCLVCVVFSYVYTAFSLLPLFHCFHFFHFLTVQSEWKFLQIHFRTHNNNDFLHIWNYNLALSLENVNNTRMISEWPSQYKNVTYNLCHVLLQKAFCQIGLAYQNELLRHDEGVENSRDL